MIDDSRWQPVPLPNLPPGHIAYQQGDDGDSPAIKIEGMNGYYVIGTGSTKDEAVGNARAKLKLIGGLLMSEGSP